MYRTDFLIKNIVIIHILLFNFSCSNGSKDNQTDEENNNGKDKVVLQIDKNQVYQTIDNFGASDAWSCQFIGQWPMEKREKIADLLFSQDFKNDGSAVGIGLSLWRFNIGAGSAGQGEASEISDEWRRAESFLQSNGTYDWEKQKGQVWFANAAKSGGVQKLLAFTNSPPVHFTKNNKAYSSDGQSNLEADKYPDFANYLADVIEGLGSMDLKVNYLSPFNEPQWDWSDATQEGCPFWNNQISDFVKIMNTELVNRGLEVSIDVGEAGKIDYLFEEADKVGRSNQITDFFSESSGNYIGNLSQVSNVISGHSYFTTSPYSTAVNKRTSLANAINNITDLNFWMSEYCVLGDNAGELDGNGRDLSINSGLYVARVIHNDLVVANASAWHWWLAVSPYDYKDGLIYVDKQKDDGQFYESKILWALGNFSRFIRPGYQRINVTKEENIPNNNLLCSGYKNPDSGGVVLVIINSDIKNITISLENGDQKLIVSKAYITSDDKDLDVFEIDNSAVEIPARSIITFLINS
ncbi:glycoside hydrolase [Abyssalbus ytuae]|uniref:Xylanase n=1 Tax=Abyssalbus ytuae TaxID=2926907 RepID=A0A9E7D3E7_9FLAO|nr:glycoside hydrolase [Abyssalbus ytuae]UOB17769.1 xylanase [Abyssalbus ytuae]